MREFETRDFVNSNDVKSFDKHFEADESQNE
jgi:hypothetical protein